jgi:hypothetical protein
MGMIWTVSVINLSNPAVANHKPIWLYQEQMKRLLDCLNHLLCLSILLILWLAIHVNNTICTFHKLIKRQNTWRRIRMV